MSKSFQLFCFAVLVAVTHTTVTSQAAPNSSWSRKPVWAEESGQPSPGRRASNVSREEASYRAEISPFSPGSNNLAIEIGQVFLMGDVGNRYSDNIGVSGHFTYGVSELFGFDSSLGYSDHSDGKYSMLTALTGLRTNLAWYDKVVPYFVFGLGFYKPSFEITNIGAQEINTISPLLFGVHMGPGVDLQITRSLFFGASMRFHNIFGNTRLTATGPIDVGGTFTSFLIHAGVTF